MRKTLAFAAISLAALAFSSQASAALVLFNITGANAISFTVNQSPTPDFSTSNFFRLNAYPYTLNGSPTASNIDFAQNGGLNLLNFSFQGYSNFFSGTTTSPTFLLGKYSLYGGPIPSDYSLSITAVPSVPEPATWAMMLLGFSGIGLVVRRDRKKLAHAQIA